LVRTPTRRLSLLSLVRRLLPAVAVLPLVVPTPGAAFKRTQTCEPTGAFECEPGEEPKPIAWPIRCVEYRINDDGSDDFSDGEQLTPALRQHVRDAFAAWVEPNCSDLQMSEGEPTDSKRVQYRQSAGFSGNMNLIVWRDEEWPNSSGRHSFALSNVTFNSETAEIRDVDIEVNTADFDYTYFEEPPNGPTDEIDIGNVLTHEVGHFVGLDHSSDREATMFSSAGTGEIKKRTLEEDDIQGLCTAYFAGDEPASCENPSDFEPPQARSDGGCGCSRGGPGRAPSPLWFGLLSFGYLVVRFGRTNSREYTG